MQALSDEQQIERLEKKVDDGFAETKSELRELSRGKRDDIHEVRGEIADVRGELGGLNRSIMAMWLTIMAMWLTMILGFAGILLQHHL
jgi:hypothetical protein